MECTYKAITDHSCTRDHCIDVTPFSVFIYHNLMNQRLNYQYVKRICIGVTPIVKTLG